MTCERCKGTGKIDLWNGGVVTMRMNCSDCCGSTGMRQVGTCDGGIWRPGAPWPFIPALPQAGNLSPLVNGGSSQG
jgi:hypothetical protein